MESVLIDIDRGSRGGFSASPRLRTRSFLKIMEKGGKRKEGKDLFTSLRATTSRATLFTVSAVALLDTKTDGFLERQLSLAT